jgi:ribosomal protein L7/L12
MDVDALIESLTQPDSKIGVSELVALRVSCQVLAAVHLEMSGSDSQLSWGHAFSSDASLGRGKPKYGLEDSISKFIHALKEDKQFREDWDLEGLSLDLDLFSDDEVPDLILDAWGNLFEYAAYFCENPEEALLPVELNQGRYWIPFPEQDSRKFSVTLEEIGPEKAKVGKIIRSLIQGLELNEAVELINSTPVTILESISKEQADSAKSALEAIGARVSIKLI